MAGKTWQEVFKNVFQLFFTLKMCLNPSAVCTSSIGWIIVVVKNASLAKRSIGSTGLLVAESGGMDLSKDFNDYTSSSGQKKRGKAYSSRNPCVSSSSG